MCHMSGETILSHFIEGKLKHESKVETLKGTKNSIGPSKKMKLLQLYCKLS